MSNDFVEFTALVTPAVENAVSIHFEGCHKIYLALDSGERATFDDLGYESAEPSVEKLWEWFQQGCGLEFISAVRSVPEGEDPNSGFERVIEQFHFMDESEDDE